MNCADSTVETRICLLQNNECADSPDGSPRINFAARDIADGILSLVYSVCLVWMTLDQTFSSASAATVASSEMPVGSSRPISVWKALTAFRGTLSYTPGSTSLSWC